MKKIIILLLILFLITGCEVDYQLDIDKDLTIHETVKMTGSSSFFNIYNKSSKLNVINMMLDTDDRKETLIKNGYTYTIEKTNIPYVLATKEYHSLDSYVDNTIFYKQYFNNINSTTDNNIVTLKISDFIPNDPENPERYDIKGLIIKIKLPYIATENNADSYDKNTNTYKWTITNKTTEKEINLKFDKSKIYINDLVKYISIAILIIIVIVIVIGIRKIIENNKKNNRIVV